MGRLNSANAHRRLCEARVKRANAPFAGANGRFINDEMTRRVESKFSASPITAWLCGAGLKHRRGITSVTLSWPQLGLPSPRPPGSPYTVFFPSAPFPVNVVPRCRTHRRYDAFYLSEKLYSSFSLPFFQSRGKTSHFSRHRVNAQRAAWPPSCKAPSARKADRGTVRGKLLR